MIKPTLRALLLLLCTSSTSVYASLMYTASLSGNADFSLGAADAFEFSWSGNTGNSFTPNDEGNVNELGGLTVDSASLTFGGTTYSMDGSGVSTAFPGNPDFPFLSMSLFEATQTFPVAGASDVPSGAEVIGFGQNQNSNQYTNADLSYLFIWSDALDGFLFDTDIVDLSVGIAGFLPFVVNASTLVQWEAVPTSMVFNFDVEDPTQGPTTPMPTPGSFVLMVLGVSLIMGRLRK